MKICLLAAGCVVALSASAASPVKVPFAGGEGEHYERRTAHRSEGDAGDIARFRELLLEPVGPSWLSVPEAPVHGEKDDPVRAADGTSWFATAFTNGADVVRARWTVAGLGIFEAYVNGRRVGDDFLKPGYTNGKRTQYAFTYDVTGLLNVSAGAENRLAAEVGSGWWRDSIVGYLGRKSAFRGDLELTLADGSVRHVATNVRDWRCGVAGTVTHAGIYDGEEYDARNVQPVCGEGLVSKPEENKEFTGELLPAAGAKVVLRRDLTRRPAKAYAWKGVTGAMADAFGTVKVVRTFAPEGPYELKAGETLVLDYGQNAAAVPRFRFSAVRGTVLTALPAEMLNDGNGAKVRGNDGPEGSVYRVNLREGYEKGRLVRYTFAGGAADYLPRFTFFGYRYLSVSATDDVRIEGLEMVPVSSVTSEMEIGTLETGNASVNRLVSNARWGMRSNYLSVPTDCPQRDERCGWTADTQVFCETATYFADVRAFFHKWLRDLRDSQDALGGYPGVAPAGRYGGATMRIGWADAGVIVPHAVWRQFGDRSIVDESWDSMARYMARVNETRYEHEAIAGQSVGYQYADWLSFEKYESNSGRWKDDRATAQRYWNYLGGCYWLMDASLMAEMAHGTGRDAAPYERMAADAKAYLKTTFFSSPDGLIDAPFRDMQTPAVFALRLGLVDGAAHEATLEGLLANFAAHGGSLQTGFLGTSILMDTLTGCGRVDAAYGLLLNRNFPGWLYSVDQGATTIWERWNSYTKDRGFGPVGMNSFNHYAYGSVVAWIYKHAAGIVSDPSAPGYRRVLLAPKPDRRLGFVKASYRSAAGLITSHWRYEGDRWTWEFSVPAGATASVVLPGETTAHDYAAGTHVIEM